ncbi:hypothetical protein K491DRAFT_677600 [Lophiostoma macrostomum CBS 122681]|uniref:Uncharacterized protein n=1 Tax=Lophiostoma macrostomum CBS 122681 TaxID=1314788 RepID=A0A6A6TCE5_9PLEO|nr:hypothetical protein K491DRAFT_677600 [Lophiostoma macrostomum CBS 122681]
MATPAPTSIANLRTATPAALRAELTHVRNALHQACLQGARKVAFLRYVGGLDSFGRELISRSPAENRLRASMGLEATSAEARRIPVGAPDRDAQLKWLSEKACWVASIQEDVEDHSRERERYRRREERLMGEMRRRGLSTGDGRPLTLSSRTGYPQLATADSETRALEFHATGSSSTGSNTRRALLGGLSPVTLQSESPDPLEDRAHKDSSCFSLTFHQSARLFESSQAAVRSRLPLVSHLRQNIPHDEVPNIPPGPATTLPDNPLSRALTRRQQPILQNPKNQSSTSVHKNLEILDNPGRPYNLGYRCPTALPHPSPLPTSPSYIKPPRLLRNAREAHSTENGPPERLNASPVLLSASSRAFDLPTYQPPTNIQSLYLKQRDEKNSSSATLRARCERQVARLETLERGKGDDGICMDARGGVVQRSGRRRMDGECCDAGRHTGECSLQGLVGQVNWKCTYTMSTYGDPGSGIDRDWETEHVVYSHSVFLSRDCRIRLHVARVQDVDMAGALSPDLPIKNSSTVAVM